MISALIRCFAVLCVLAAAPVSAQQADAVPSVTDEGTDPSLQAQSDPLSESEQAQADALPDVFPDLSDWNAFAARVTAALEAGRASNTVLTDLRGELADWRDTFLARQSTNAARIATVRAQLAALGAVPETGDEDLRVAARRADLTEELQQLRAPQLIAAEAHTRANGLIGEIDSLIRERQTERVAERIASPLNPGTWGGAFEALRLALTSTTAEVTGNLNNPSRRSLAVDRAPAILALLAVALVLVTRGRRWFESLTTLIETRTPKGQGVVRFVVSLGQVVVPFVGLIALSNAIQLTGLAGRRLDPILEALPLMGLFPILAHWLAGLLLPKQDVADHPLRLSNDTSTAANRRLIGLGYALFAFGLAQTFLTANAVDAVSHAVLMFPLGVVLCWTLYWLGKKLRENPAEEDEAAGRSVRQTLKGFLSRGVMVAAAASVILAAVGYAAVFDAIAYPAAVTLFVLGVLVLLQRLSVDAYSLVASPDNAAQDALIPVLIGFLLVALALPVLAIIWGAQVTDLTELWAQFQEGFSLGETQISPTTFLFFVVIFVVGYTITRLLQAALRSTVLPRTKLDVGAQNAIIAGLGYVGIFIAAVVAITTAGIDLSGLAIVAGALSVGIGFGLQNIVSNFVAGIILLIERPISEGDWIEVGGQMGYVRDISVRSTRIETFDRTDVIVPNADLVSGQVTNWTRGNNVGRVIVPVGVAYGTDTELVTGILKEIAEAHPMVLMNPGPSVLFRGFGADSLDFEIRAILRDVNWVMAVHSDMNHEINKRFAEAGIEIPFAQRDLWLRNPETLYGPGRGTPPQETET